MYIGTFLSLAVSMILYKLDEEPYTLSLVFIYARLCPLYLEHILTRAICYNIDAHYPHSIIW